LLPENNIISPTVYDFVPEKENRSKYNFVGIRNLGSTCYMNSLLQILYNNTTIRNYFIYQLSYDYYYHNNDEKSNANGKVEDLIRKDHFEEMRNDIGFQLQKIFLSLLLSEKKFFVPTDFTFAFKDETGINPMNCLYQQDAQEFFLMLCHRFEESILFHQKKIKEEFGEEKAKKNENAPLPPVPTDIFQTAFGCKICDQRYVAPSSSSTEANLSSTVKEQIKENIRKYGIRESEEKTVCVSVPITNCKNLEESLNKFVEGEKITDYQWDENNKQNKVTIIKKQCLSEVSNTILFHLQRFTIDYNTFRREKLNDNFAFPRKLNMKPYMKEFQETNIADGKSVAPRDDDYYEYELVGVIVHTGTSDSGHYYTYVKDQGSSSVSKKRQPGKGGEGRGWFKEDENQTNEDENGNWYEFNDSEISTFDPKTQLERECFGGKTSIPEYTVSTQQIHYSESVNQKNAYMIIYNRIHPSKDNLPPSPALSPITPQQPTTTTTTRPVPSSDKELESVQRHISSHLLQSIAGKIQKENHLTILFSKIMTKEYFHFYNSLLFTILYQFHQHPEIYHTEKRIYQIFFETISFWAAFMTHSNHYDECKQMMLILMNSMKQMDQFYFMKNQEGQQVYQKLLAEYHTHSQHSHLQEAGKEAEGKEADNKENSPQKPTQPLEKKLKTAHPQPSGNENISSNNVLQELDPKQFGLSSESEDKSKDKENNNTNVNVREIDPANEEERNGNENESIPTNGSNLLSGNTVPLSPAADQSSRSLLPPVPPTREEEKQQQQQSPVPSSPLTAAPVPPQSHHYISKIILRLWNENFELFLNNLLLPTNVELRKGIAIFYYEFFQKGFQCEAPNGFTYLSALSSGFSSHYDNDNNSNKPSFDIEFGTIVNSMSLATAVVSTTAMVVHGNDNKDGENKNWKSFTTKEHDKKTANPEEEDNDPDLLLALKLSQEEQGESKNKNDNNINDNPASNQSVEGTNSAQEEAQVSRKSSQNNNENNDDYNDSSPQIAEAIPMDVDNNDNNNNNNDEVKTDDGFDDLPPLLSVADSTNVTNRRNNNNSAAPVAPSSSPVMNNNNNASQTDDEINQLYADDPELALAIQLSKESIHAPITAANNSIQAAPTPATATTASSSNQGATTTAAAPAITNEMVSRAFQAIPNESVRFLCLLTLDRSLQFLAENWRKSEAYTFLLSSLVQPLPFIRYLLIKRQVISAIIDLIMGDQCPLNGKLYPTVNHGRKRCPSSFQVVSYTNKEKQVSSNAKHLPDWTHLLEVLVVLLRDCDLSSSHYNNSSPYLTTLANGTYRMRMSEWDYLCISNKTFYSILIKQCRYLPSLIEMIVLLSTENLTFTNMTSEIIAEEMSVVTVDNLFGLFQLMERILCIQDSLQRHRVYQLFGKNNQGSLLELMNNYANSILNPPSSTTGTTGHTTSVNYGNKVFIVMVFIRSFLALLMSVGVLYENMTANLDTIDSWSIWMYQYLLFQLQKYNMVSNIASAISNSTGGGDNSNNSSANTPNTTNKSDGMVGGPFMLVYGEEFPTDCEMMWKTRIEKTVEFFTTLLQSWDIIDMSKYVLPAHLSNPFLNNNNNSSDNKNSGDIESGGNEKMVTSDRVQEISDTMTDEEFAKYLQNFMDSEDSKNTLKLD
jgi:ubiquitin C-terminal hydrolase